MTEGPVVIVGAGVAGLACAGALRAAGREVVVLEKARGVGGRCATRRVEGQPADLGPLFVHGSDPRFLAAVDAVDAERREGWPHVLSGEGAPCHPHGFRSQERRLAFVDGATAFPKHLARGIPVRLESKVTRLEVAAGGLSVQLDGAALTAATVVLTPPAEQAGALLEGLVGTAASVRGLKAWLATVRSEPALALVARYAPGTALPDWDVWHPEGDSVLQVVSVESRKRCADAAPMLVFQTRRAWSRARLEVPPDVWADELLAIAAQRLGSWAGRPVARHAHRWRYARADRSALWPGPVVIDLPGRGRLGLAGDLFGPGGGIEGAYLSGRALAARLLE